MLNGTPDIVQKITMIRMKTHMFKNTFSDALLEWSVGAKDLPSGMVAMYLLQMFTCLLLQRLTWSGFTCSKG